MAGDPAQPTPAGGRGPAAGRAAAHEEARPAAHKGAAEGPKGDWAATACHEDLVLRSKNFALIVRHQHMDTQDNCHWHHVRLALQAAD